MVYHNSIRHPELFSTKNGKTVVSINANSINNCLGLLFTTSKGELLGDPEFGSNIMEHVYEPNDTILKDMLTQDILETIRKYEPRITVSNINFTTELNTVDINIRYYINNMGTYGDFRISVDRE